MKIEMSHREQTDEERRVWEMWCDYTDRAKLAPDCQRDWAYIARRFNEETGNMSTPEYAKSLAPENHPNYPWTRR